MNVNRTRAFTFIRFTIVPLPLLIFLFAPLRVCAQAPEIGGLLPSGGPRGQTTTVEIAGKNMGGAAVHVGGTGLTLKSVKPNPAGDKLAVEFSVAPNASLGPHDIRITTAKGVSNGARFWVDIFPIPLDKPVVINGRIGAKAARDRFLISAQAGETWAFDCCAVRIRSRFDPVLEIRDEKGSLLRLAQSTWEQDPRFAYTFPRAGKFALIVRDSEYLGGPNFTYRLLVGRMPFVSGFLPRGEQPGKTIGLQVESPNIPGRTPVSAAIPPGTPSGEFWTDIHLPTGHAALVPLLIDSMPVAAVTETDATMPLPIPPIALDGTFERYSRIKFFFHGLPGEHYELDLYGRRIGSRIDGAIRVFDAAGKEVASNDDAIEKDARLEFAPKVDGLYTIEARNAEEKMGPDCYYRLAVRKVGPDFRVNVSTDRINLPAAGTAALAVTAQRIGGFDGPIRIKCDGLPAGVHCSGGTIAAGKDKIEVTITGNSPIPLAAPIHVWGEAIIAGNSVSHEAPAWEQYEHRSIDLLLSVEYTYTRPHYLWDLFMLGGTDTTEPVSLEALPSSISLAPGASIELVVKAIRRPGADGEIKLEFRGLPDKVTASAGSIPAKQSEVRIKLASATDAPAGIGNLIIQGKLDKAVILAPAVEVTLTK
jgi:hypothetical protein